MTASLTRRAALRMGSGLGLGSFLAGGPAKALPSLVPGSVPAPEPLPRNTRTWDLFTRFEADHLEWRRLPDSSIDPDLRGMTSLSPTVRLIIQRQRNSERRSTLYRLRKTLGLL